MDQIKIGRFVAETRRAKGLTQRQLADQLSISDKTISKWRRVNPKFCVKSNKCMNGAKFICRRQRHDRLPPMSTT